MIIGDNFSKRARELLIEIANQAGSDTTHLVDVDQVCEILNIGRKEARNLFDYLEVKGLITIQNIGGAYLYSSVFITEKGLQRIQDWKAIFNFLKKKDVKSLGLYSEKSLFFHFSYSHRIWSIQ